ncbi:hypothetical protein HYW35_02255 [Candidatus Saccharibacteria bacterium]|nr:hypothetical protein [Candidatus Saccharibacteria bacterium]
MKIFKKNGLGLILLYALAFLLPLLALPHKALADSIKNRDEICVPQYQGGTDNNHHAVKDWLSASFVSRAEIKIEYHAKGNCQIPATTNSATFFGNVTFAEIFKNISGQDNILLLTNDNLNNTDGNKWQYRDRTSGDDSDDDTRIDQLVGLSIPEDGAGGRDKIVDINDLKQYLQKAEITLSFESSSAIISYDCNGSDSNFTLADGGTPKWECHNSGSDDSALGFSDSPVGGVKGFQIGLDNFKDLENFNITYTVGPDSTGTNNLVIQHVSEKMRDSRTFTLCGDKYLNKACNGSDLWLHGSQQDIKAIGAGKQNVTISKFDAGQPNAVINPFEVVVAGQANPSSQDAALQAGEVPGACGDLSACLNTTEGPDSSACAADSQTGFEWLACPLMTSMSKFADVINGYVEDQLHFRVDSMLPDCSKSSSDQDCQVNRAWSIIKNIVAALLVIIMLVMVISQAIDKGPFDPYTVKKVLPKLVIAVIVMQFSWVLTKYMIGFANELGVGLKQIMLAPFGGGGNLDLPSIMHHLNPEYPPVANWAIMGVMLTLLFTFKTFILPAVLFIALAVGSALFVALVTLVFRNILIIMAVIFSPLALLLWVLPGQTFQGYWKKYTDNFIKLLLLFPLVIAMIYAGRIAAWLGGNIGLPGPIDYLVVLIAFFGPLFFLPKTFKWGGSILAGVNQAVRENKLLNQGKGLGNQFIKDMFGDRSALRFGRYYNEKDDYLKRQTFGTGKNGQGRWWQRGSRKYNPLAFATTKGERDAEGRLVGRRNLFGWEGRKIVGVGGGALWESRRQLEGMLRRSEQHKGTTDEGGKTRFSRLIEAARAGSIPALKYFKKDGKWQRKAFPKGEKNPSYDAGFAAALPLLNADRKKDDRIGEAAALAAGTHPEVGIHMGDGIKLDPDDLEFRALNHLWNKRHPGKKRRPYDAKQSTQEAADDMNKFEELHAIPETEGRDRTPEEQKEMEEIQVMFELWQGGVKKTRRGRTKRMREKIDYLRKTREWALEPVDNTPFGKVIDEIKKPGEEFYMETLTNDPSLTMKSASTPELNERLKQLDRYANANVHSKFDAMLVPGTLRHYQSTNDPDALIGKGKYSRGDIGQYADTDHSPPSAKASMSEGSVYAMAERAAEDIENVDIGLIGHDNIPDADGNYGLALGESTKFLEETVKDIGHRDASTSQVIASWRGVPSTARGYEKVLENTWNPKNILEKMVPKALRIPENRPYYAAASRKAIELRDLMGIDRYDGRPNELRDLFIMENMAQLQEWYPQADIETVRAYWDRKKDPKGVKPAVPADFDALPDDFKPGPPNPPLTPEEIRRFSLRDIGGPAMASGGAAAEARIGARRGGVPPVNPRPGGEALSGGPGPAAEDQYLGPGHMQAAGGARAEASLAAKGVAPAPQATSTSRPEVETKVKATGAQIRSTFEKAAKAASEAEREVAFDVILHLEGEMNALKPGALVSADDVHSLEAEMKALEATPLSQASGPRTQVAAIAVAAPTATPTRAPQAAATAPAPQAQPVSNQPEIVTAPAHAAPTAQFIPMPAAPPANPNLFAATPAPQVTKVEQTVVNQTAAPASSVRTLSQSDNTGSVSTGSLRGGGGSVDTSELRISHNNPAAEDRLADLINRETRRAYRAEAVEQRKRQGANTTPPTNPPIPGNEPPPEVRGPNDPGNLPR